MLYCNGKKSKKDSCLERRRCSKYMGLIRHRCIPNFKIEDHSVISLYVVKGNNSKCTNFERL